MGGSGGSNNQVGGLAGMLNSQRPASYPDKEWHMLDTWQRSHLSSQRHHTVNQCTQHTMTILTNALKVKGEFHLLWTTYNTHT